MEKKLRKEKSTKEKVLMMLSAHREGISGEEISSNLNVSRTSIWKHIKALRADGYDIESKVGSGYKLLANTDKISEYSIKDGLRSAFIGQNIKYMKTVDSTNSYALKIANELIEGSVIVSSEQTCGRGRTGRRWISKDGEGIYFSIVLKPNIPVAKASFITQIAGAAMVETLQDMGIDVKIKWPNDIIIGSKKICGILTEMSAEIDRIHYIVLGIGLNISAKDFDDEIMEKATSIKNEGYDFDCLEFLKMFFLDFENRYVEYLNGDVASIMEIIRRNSAVIARWVYIVGSNGKKEVFVENIDDDGNLLVRDLNGSIDTVFTGEVSIRGMDSYI